MADNTGKNIKLLGELCHELSLFICFNKYCAYRTTVKLDLGSKFVLSSH